MKIKAILLIFLICLLSQTGVTAVIEVPEAIGAGIMMMGGGVPVEAADGPNVWYYAFDNGDDFSTGGNCSAGAVQGAKITVVTAGSCTKISVKVASDSGAATKIAIYNAAGTTLLGSGTLTANSGWQDATLGTPVNVSAATDYLVAWCSEIGMDAFYNTNHNGHWIADVGYANFPTSTSAYAVDVGYGQGVRMYVD